MSLGYEQLCALRILRDPIAFTPNIEASDLAKEADCSWEELYQLAELDLIKMGEGRVAALACHPVITLQGLAALETAEKEGTL
jgi:hypothetical protein